MRPSTCHPCSSSSPAASGLSVRTALAIGALILLTSGLSAPAAFAEDKRASAATTLPAVPLSARQLADIAAKGVPSATQPAPVLPAATTLNLHTDGPRTGLERIAEKVATLQPRRLPAISEAMGPIPRESWIREALGKRGDVAVVGGRLVPVVTGGVAR